MSADGHILVCFAVPEEARPFLKRVHDRKDVRVLVTGMGQSNARRSANREISQNPPRCVVTSGFAGGLNPKLAVGSLVVEADHEHPLLSPLLAAGAVTGQFHCAERVLATAAEKNALHQSTGCDAVEMESAAIRAICRERKILSATVRVISDAADEDLPLDFNQFMNTRHEMNYFLLAGAILKSPGKIGALKRFQKQINSAAERLAAALEAAIDPL